MSFLQLIYVTAASLCAISLVSAADFGNVKGPQGQPSFNPGSYSGTGGTTGGARANTNAATGAPIGSATLSSGTATDSGATRSGGSQSSPIGSATLSSGTATDSGSTRSGGSQSSPIAASPSPGGQSIANVDITDSTPLASTDAASSDCYQQQLPATAPRPPGVQGRLSPRGCGNGGNTSSGGDLGDAGVFDVN
jgi:hypothetical protein